MLLAISAVNATDNTSDLLNIEDGNVIINEQTLENCENGNDLKEYEINYRLSGTENDELNYALDEGSFKDLKNDITNATDELNLTRDYVFDSSVDTAGAIIIDKPIVINGNGHDILAESKTGVFSITSSNVVLKNINFYDCSGRAIDWQAANGNLINCKFEDCKNTANGGVVHWKGVNGSISNCVFKRCSSSSYGVLYSEYSSDLKVDGCEFSNSKSGAAIYVTTRGISINNCTFKSNSGGVAIYGSTSVASCINNSKFIGNSNRAINWYGNNLEIDNSIFINNSYKSSRYFNMYGPVNNQGTLDVYGGAVYISGNYTRISNTVFKGNKVSASIESHVDKYKDTTFNQWNYYNIRETFKINSYGGAVYVKGNKFYLNNISCEDNSAYSSGKVYIEYSGITYDMVGINMYQNVYANSYGGAIYLDGGGILSNSYISENMLEGYANVDLGKIASDVCPTKCVVKGYGVGVYWKGYSRNNLVNNTVFVQNNLGSGQTGSALYLNNFNGDVNSNIFLENPNKVINSSASEFSADYNWWGNTASNFNQMIAPDDLAITKWLFLNMSSDKSNLEIGDKAIVTLDLSNVYDSSSNTISHSYEISNIEFDLVCNKLNANVSNVIINDGVANFEILAQNYGQGSLIAEYNGIISTLTFDISKKTSQIKSQINNCSVYKDELIAYLNMSSNATGTLKVYLNNNLYSTISLNGENVFSIDLTGLNVNNYTLEAVYNGDNIYSGSSDTITFEIKKAHNTVQISNPYTVYYGEIITLNVDKGNVTDGTLLIQIKNSGDVLIYNHTYNIIDMSNINLPVLDAGDYNLFITYESNNYYGSQFDSTFTVNKLNPTVNNEIINTIYGKSEVLFGSSVDGILKINVLNNTYKTFNINSNIENSLNLSDLDAGDYEIEFVFVPNNQNYNEVTIETTLTIFKSEPAFDIVIGDINYKESANLNVNYLNDITGFANITISNDEGFEIKYSNVELNGSNINKVLNNLNASKYTITLEYSGNDNYYSTTLSKTFTVLKIDPIIMADVTNAEYGQNAKIIVNSNAEGNITIKIGSVKTYEELLINDKRVSQNIMDLDAGTYDVNVTYNGNKNYNTKTVNTQLTIFKVNTNVVASVDDITYSETTVINVRSSIDGEITVKVNSTFIKTVDVIANTVTPVTFDNVPVGKHEVSVELNPLNKNYNESSFNTYFTVSKKQTSVSLDVEDSVYGEDVIVSVTASEDGVVVLTVGDITRERIVLANTMVKFNLGILAADSYDVSVSFDAGSNYRTSSKEDTIVVSPAVAEIISIQSRDNVYGENTTINVKTNVGGVLTIKINDIAIKTFNIIANKLTTFDLGKYDVNDYNIDLSLDAGSNYSNATGTVEFTVTPKQTTVKIDVDNNVYGNNVIVNVTASENGIVAVTVGNNEKSVNVEANKVYYVDFGILDAKSYSVNATFNGGNNYEESTDVSSLTVYPAQSKITEIQVSDNVYGENVIVKVKTNVDGNLTVNLGDEQKVNEVIANQFTSFDFGILDVNKYDVILNLDAGNNYISDNNSTKITVSPKVVYLTLGVVNSIYGDDVIVNVTSDYAGEVILKVGDIIKPIVVSTNKVTSVNLGILNASVYDCELNMELNNNFIVNKAISSLTVSPKVVYLTLGVVNSIYGNNVIVNVSASENGNIAVQVGAIIKNLDITANKLISIDFGILDVNDYEVTASFYAGSNYISAKEDTLITIYPKNTTVSLDVKEYMVGENIIVNVSASENGNITVQVGTVIKEVNVESNKVYSVDMGTLNSGLYNIDVNFTGGSNYVDSHESVVVKVLSKIDEDDVNITIPKIVANQETQIIINLPGDATGTVTLIVGNDTYSFNVEKGIATVTVPKLEKGNYDYIIAYSGDGNYSSFSTSGSFEVSKSVPDIIIPPLDNPSSDGSITINLPAGATGTVTLVIDKKPYSFPVNNGVAKIYMPDLTNGNYQYTITYSGDSKYSSFSKTGIVTVNKPASKPVTKTTLTLKKVKVKRSAKKLTIQATLKINGKAVKGKIIKFKFNKKSYKAKTNARGVAKITVKKSVLKKLKKGKKVTYIATYGKITKKVTVKVKK